MRGNSPKTGVRGDGGPSKPDPGKVDLMIYRLNSDDNL